MGSFKNIKNFHGKKLMQIRPFDGEKVSHHTYRKIVEIKTDNDKIILNKRDVVEIINYLSLCLLWSGEVVTIKRKP